MYLIVFFLIFAFGVPVVSAENPITLAEIDSQHEKSQLQIGYQEIASQIEKVLASNPNQYQWQWRQARTQYSLAKKAGESTSDHYDLCILHSSLAIDLQPDSAVSYFYRGLCRGKQGEMKGVWASLGIIEPFQEDMIKAVELGPKINHAGPHRALGKLYLELPFFLGGDSDKAVFHLKEAVRLAPDYAENHLGLAQILVKKNNPTQARESLHKLIQLTDNTQDEKLLSLRKEGMELLESLTP
ncbi:tetratricopeptide repeat protein [Nitrospinaceae bacterium]|nr:tetratricopeptide repeat protein [Nitrospinaceae bacterium]